MRNQGQTKMVKMRLECIVLGKAACKIQKVAYVIQNCIQKLYNGCNSYISPLPTEW